MSILFEDEGGRALKTWLNAEFMGGCPMMGDRVLLRWGYEGEGCPEEYEVLYRVIDGLVSDRVRCIVRRCSDDD